MPLPFQLGNERVLYRTRRSRAALLVSLLQSLWQGAILGGVLAAMGASSWFIGVGEIPWVLPFSIVVSSIMLIAWRHSIIWKNSTLTITTQRIFIHAYDLVWEEEGRRTHHRSFFRAVTHTVRWDAYQESIYEGGIRQHLWNTGILTIRHGTADAFRSLSIAAIPYAQDLKHYLDKIQSLKVAKAPDSELPAFVPAKRGKRDRAVLTYV